MKRKQEPVRIAVFPDSGHQFFEIPLKRLVPDREEEFLRAFAVRNRAAWAPWSEFTPWILFQYAIDTHDEPILRLAVESNLGPPTRGLLFDVDDTPLREPPDEDEVISAYASSEEAQIEADFRDRLIPLRNLPNKEGKVVDIHLEIFWPRRGGFEPVDVDLIVDLGNTRTVALLLESPGQDPLTHPLNRRIRILRFIPRGTPFSLTPSVAGAGVLQDDCAIIDSWMLLHRPLFYHLEPPVSEGKLSTHYERDSTGEWVTKRYLPHAFVELSPALIGGGRHSPEGVYKVFAGVSLDTDARFYLSSPKRYAWDDEPQGLGGGTFWRQIPNPTDGTPPDKFDRLGGLVRYFMDPGGVDWDIDAPPDPDDFRGLPFPGADPSYPRRDAICWFALSVIEAAYRQINAPEHLRAAGREDLPRRLRHIRVTYPAGWTMEERRRYLDQWQRAINLFTLTRFNDHRPLNSNNPRAGGRRPQLAQPELDEAVASQLPIIYSDIAALGGADAWFALMGRDDAVTVMNLDIGGGTSDLSIIRYTPDTPDQRGGGSRLRSELLFRDGYNIAGDRLVRRIIETILLPEWLRASGLDQFEGFPEARRWIARFFLKPGHSEFLPVDPKAPRKLARIVRLVFVPLVNFWLARFSDPNPDAPWEKLNIAERLEEGLIDRNVLNDLNDLITRVIRLKTPRGTFWEGTAFRADSDVALHCERRDIEACIDAVFARFFENIGSLAGRFDCQMVIVSGKPSELPRIRDRLLRAFPLPPQRIIHVKNFPAGDWYPFSTFSEGRIVDAKTCTVVGAALYQDIANGNLQGVSIREANLLRAPRQCFWGIIPSNGPAEDFHRNLLFTPADYPADGYAATLQTPPKTFDLPLPCRIGRQLVKMPGVDADPVYEIRYEPGTQPPPVGARIRAKMRWTSGRTEGERLEFIEAVPHPDFPEVNCDLVIMRLNTMLEDSHWLDVPSFNSPKLCEANEFQHI
ncbi:MAG: virulence factor SrfB [Opitutales bacterium]|nr:virulence factor SrfB [Opitutales bacterium]